MTIAGLKTSAPSADSASAVRKVLPDEAYQNFLSRLAKSRKPAAIRHLLPLETRPNMISMLSGKPNPEVFPYASITMEVRSPDPRSEASTKQIVLDGEDLTTALQYGLTSSNPELVEWLTDLTCHLHGSQKDEGWRVSLGIGSQDLLYKTFNALVDPGDSIFVESPTYPNVLPIIHALRCEVIEIPTDGEGITPSSMRSILENWPDNKPRPKLMYTVPYGSNPSGSTTSLSRRLELLSLARKYNFLIFEDDPYFHLYYGELPRPPSYFSLERKVDGEIGRVLRLDSFSKILAAGFRTGWVTGPDALVRAIESHNAQTTMGAAPFSQMMILKLLKTWGVEGFLAHTARCADFYREKRDIFEKYLRKHLTGLAEWTTPNASMFVWMKLKLPPSVEAANVKEGNDEGDSAAYLEDKALEGGVLWLPGGFAYMDERRTCRVRVAFSYLSETEVDEALRRVACMLRGTVSK